MIENTDPHQVVMSRETFDKLFQAALMGGHLPERDAARMMWHIRKYNRPLHEERQQEVQNYVQQMQVLRQLVYTLSRYHLGEEVMVKRVFSTIPARLIGRDPNRKFCMLVEGPVPEKRGKIERYSVSAQQVILKTNNQQG